MRNLVLTVSNFGIKLSNSPWILKNISFDVREGECLVITGPNASGKSTLLRSIARMYTPYSISKIEGEIDYRVENTIVFQRPKSQIVSFRVDEEIASPMSYQRVDRSTRVKRVNELLERYNISHLGYRDPRKLSSGQQQSVVVLSNTMTQAKLILLDEPFATLDAENKKQLINLLAELKNNNYTIVIIHHSPMDLDGIADNVLILEEGVVSFFGSLESKKEHFESKINNFAFDEIEFDHDPNWFIDVNIGYSSFQRKIKKEFPKKGLVLIKGRNGSGKTTLLRTLIDFIPKLDGKIKFSNNLFFVPQDVQAFFWRKTVLEELGEVSTIPGWIEPIGDRSPFIISEGQRKKLAIEIAFNSDRDLLLDEPSQGLDIDNIHWLIHRLLIYSKDRLVLLTSNDEILLEYLSRLSLETLELV